jgi:aminoglycoside 6'-N-acetyltransferase
MLSLRSMTMTDLDLVRAWLIEAHVARWYLSGSTVEQEIEDLRQSVAGEQPTRALTVLLDDRLVGWCQWYRCDEYPDYAVDIQAAPGDVGIDYAIGAADQVGHGVGTALVAALIEAISDEQGRVGIVADPEASNTASRRVLEKNGFQLVDVRPLASEPTDEPMAIYRRPAASSR